VTGLRLKEVFIHKFEEGVFYSVIVINDGVRDLQIDSRTSDAIAIAIRANCNMFTTETIMQKCSIVLDDSRLATEKDPEILPTELTAEDLQDVNKLRKQLRSFKKKDLEDRITKAVAEENYEYAKIYKDELLRREEENKKS
jgi:bifunctional DNase/RNase